jgi:glycosyltransferase involved in cell wall biosynthesis
LIGDILKFLFADATKGFSPSRKDEKACGGILTSLSTIPAYLAKKGHEVMVKSTYAEKKVVDGVSYVHIEDKELLPKWDILVVNRNGINDGLVEYSHKIGAKVVWWLHDIVDFRYLQDSSFRRVDKIIALSEYCKTSFSDFYDIPLEKFSIIPNGVDKSVFYPGEYVDRKKYSMIMASALIKGFTPVYDTFKNAKRLYPSAELTIYSSQKLHELDNNNLQTLFLKEMEEEGANVYSPIPQSILADKMRGAWVLLMPNSYPEICSNLLLQAKACGLPVVASNIGSVNEFIEDGKTGILTKYAPHDLSLWVKKYAEAVMRLMGDDDMHKQISTQSVEGIKTWDEIGEMWDEELRSLV